MTKIITLLLTLSLMGCSETPQSEAGANKQRPEEKHIWQEELDGCYYILFKLGYSGGIAHKANCPNPIHSK